jgi:hypothetical protein
MKIATGAKLIITYTILDVKGNPIGKDEKTFNFDLSMIADTLDEQEFETTPKTIKG